MITNNINPCIKCGSSARLIILCGLSYVQCIKCGFEGLSFWYESESSLISWNKRIFSGAAWARHKRLQIFLPHNNCSGV